jgi:uncharacterized SAM-binding protein YcdF (DUF218 family)
MTQTMNNARILWNYLSAGRSRGPCDLIVACGSYDLRVCDYACSLLTQGLASRMVVTGNRGNWTRHLWDTPEAELFAQRALALGIPAHRLLIEPQATNFAENIAYSRRLCPEARSAIFVTKPNSVRRVALTIPRQWPDISFHIDAPPLAFPEGISNQIGVLGLLDEMVGDLHRILVYPAKGFQLETTIPAKVMDAWQQLREQGFDRHLVAVEQA